MAVGTRIGGKPGYKPAKYLVAPPAARNKVSAQEVITMSVTVARTAKFASDRRGVKFPTHRTLVNTGKLFSDYAEQVEV